YLGPSPAQLGILFSLSLTNSITLFALGVLLARNVWVLASNVTTIEGWEIERHEALVRRARKHGGYVDGPDGMRLKISKQEFPYDIGFYKNAKQAMGGTFLLWLWPFASTPPNMSGLDFETNGFEDPGQAWPPPDPDRMPRYQYNATDYKPFTYEAGYPEFDVQAFRERQQRDALRFTNTNYLTYRRAASHQQNEGLGQEERQESPVAVARQSNGASIFDWRDSSGDRLQDFGVDEEVENDDDNVPLAELQRRRRKLEQGTQLSGDAQDTRINGF
ncbi:MAG: hypothetical protein Q9222_003299, partial [Ikaeria aurantiellina]